MKHLVFVIGPTNSGKTTLVESLRKESLGASSIHVGRLLREKHPPEFFEGQGNPPHVHKEAMRLLFEQLREKLLSPAVDVIYIDGQPRTVEQVEAIEDFVVAWGQPLRLTYLVLNADDETIRRRAASRDASQAAIELSIKRITNDKCDLHDVIHHLMCVGTNETRVMFLGRYEGCGMCWRPTANVKGEWFQGGGQKEEKPENAGAGGGSSGS